MLNESFLRKKKEELFTFGNNTTKQLTEYL